MFAFTRLSLLLGAALLSSSAAFASDWTVVKSGSSVKFTTDKTNWQPLSAGMTLPNKSWINTGSRGRVTLQRDTNIININPGTLAGVFNLGGSLDKTVVAQQTGVVALDLERKSAPWMTVQTPFLAAVVKGTKFDVAIGKNAAKVTVDRGRVEVTDPHRGEQVDVTAGQQASVDITSRSAMDVSGKGSIEPVHTVAKTEALVPATTQQKAETEKSTKNSNETGKSSKTSEKDKSSKTSEKDKSYSKSGKSGSSGDSSSSSNSGGSSSSSSSNSHSGSGNSSSGNSGNGSSGNSNSGNGNSGNGNSGNGNSGKDKSGKGNSEHGNSNEDD